jgi:hypothetical protein
LTLSQALFPGDDARDAEVRLEGFSESTEVVAARRRDAG